LVHPSDARAGIGDVPILQARAGGRARAGQSTARARDRSHARSDRRGRVMKKVVVLNDEPLLHVALQLVLEKVPANVVHVADTRAFEAALDAEVAAVIIDAAMKSSASAIETLKKKAPSAGLVLINAAAAPPGFAHAFASAEPYTDREKIAAFVNARVA